MKELKPEKPSNVQLTLDTPIQNSTLFFGIAESGEEICRGNPLWLPSTYVRVGTRPTLTTVKNHTCIQQRLFFYLF